ncbi:MAG: hypothetical protein CSA81_01245 [Acidobacteria bacterium]|nr:MAG: hypothetical protein CSA81_01245 [Acidobacteriota bacterium]
MLISDYERERLRISADMVTQLALVLEVTSDEILGLTNAKRKHFGKNMVRRMSQIEKLPSTQKKAILNNIYMYLKGALTSGN